MQRDYLLAADLGAEIGWDRLVQGDDLFEGVRDTLAAKLATVVEGSVLPAAERVRAGVFLGNLGDPRPGVCTLPPEMIPVDGGSFVIGMTPQELARLPKDKQQYFGRAVNEQPVTVKPFALGTYPVTNAQYKLFMDDRGYDPDQPWWDVAGRAWRIQNDAENANTPSFLQRERKDQPAYWDSSHFGIARPNHPVVGVTWYEAQAFCRWLSQQRTYNPQGYNFRLPSEAEWEWAARGASRRMYPWGNEELSDERANYNQIYNGTTAVGSFRAGATPEGVLDLAGNVWEWTGSVDASYPYDASDGREQPTDVARKRFTLHGGSWGDEPILLRAAFRNDNTPVGRLNYIGFRLATHL